MLNGNLSGLLFDEILKIDLQVAEDIHLEGLQFRQLPKFLAVDDCDHQW